MDIKVQTIDKRQNTQNKNIKIIFLWSNTQMLWFQIHILNIISRNHDRSKIIMWRNVLLLLLFIPFRMLFLHYLFNLVVKWVVNVLIQLTIKFWINLGDTFVKDQIASEIDWNKSTFKCPPILCDYF